ncbi:MAG TPA: hypothetical protein VES79_09305 [Solirubrobacteraceae bacterium]|nr:hypothetical protein [Solirubrobacteraceae bacterium]
MKRGAVALVCLAVVGIAVAIAGGTLGEAVGLGLVGVAAVGAVSLAFLAVGRSEDRERGRGG